MLFPISNPLENMGVNHIQLTNMDQNLQPEKILIMGNELMQPLNMIMVVMVTSDI